MINLISVFQDTAKIIQTSDALINSTQESRAKTKMYDAGFSAPIRRVKSQSINIKVIGGTSFDTARSFALGSHKVAVLNFANPHRPGGSVKLGARAQEECLCRCSNLYSVLATEELNNFYYRWHKENSDDLFSDRVIYSPGIKIIKSDDYQLLNSPVSVDIITCAAPYNGGNLDRELLKNTYESRITNILETAIDNDADTVVLGAFGCGEFENPPELMANSFKEILVNRRYYKYFENIVFAILNTNPYDSNYATFKEILT